MDSSCFTHSPPQVSIIITTKNDERCVENCLRSIQSQTYTNIEIIAVDNHSTDATLSICRQYADKVYTRGPERSAQRNFGAESARGNYLLILDSDMVLTQGLVQEAVERFQSDPDLAGLYVPLRWKGDNWICRAKGFEREFYDATCLDAARFIRTDAFKEIEGFDETLFAGEDWDLNKRLKTTGRIGSVNCKMFHYEDETITLAQYLKKMRYYAPNLNRYVRKWRHDKEDCGRQFSLWYRFWKVFTENGKWVKLLRHPVLALNMYWLKILSILVFLLGRNDTGSKKGAIQKEADSPFHKQALEPRVIHVEFAKTGTGLSGGEKCMIENIQYFLKQNLRNILFTTDNGRHTYEKLGLKEGPFFEYRTIRSHSHETRYPMLLSYIVRVFQAVRHVRSFQIFDNDILFCHSEFFPNTIPFYLLARKNLKAKIFYWAHMPSPHLFKGYVGHFSNTFHLPNLKIIFLKLNQVFYAAIRNNRGTVLSVNEYFRKKLGSEFKGNRVYIVRRYGGVSVSQEETTRKEYDLAWMGRFHPQKGIMEIPEILNRLKELGRNSSLVLLGGGSDSLKDKLFAKLDLYGLKTQVDWKGFISGDQKFDSLRKARLYLMTSYYEGFPGVVLEAMKCGIPVLAYDLPIYAPYIKGMVKVPFLDKEAMARVALDLLSDSKRYDRLCQDALEFSSLYSWENTSKEILDLMKLPEPSTLHASVERS